MLGGLPFCFLNMLEMADILTRVGCSLMLE